MATSNFTFATLTGTETAGWNSINTLITSIDTQLNSSNRLVYMTGWSAVAGQTIKWDATNSRWIPGTLDGAAIANNAVTLGTQTTGDYVASIAAAGTNEVSVTGSGEGAAATVRLANNTALRGAATVETPPAYSGGSTGTVGRVPDAKYVTDALAYATSGNVTLGGDVTGNASANSIANGAVTEAKIASNAVTNVKLADNSVGTAEIIDGNVTYPKLGTDTKRYGVNNTATSGTYYTSTGDLNANSLSSQANKNHLVIANSASAMDLRIPYNLGNLGDTITVARMGSGTVTLLCLADGPSGQNCSFQNNDLSANITDKYGVVTLICIGTAAAPFPTESGAIGGNTWLITGDYT